MKTRMCPLPQGEVPPLPPLPSKGRGFETDQAPPPHHLHVGVDLSKEVSCNPVGVVSGRDLPSSSNSASISNRSFSS